jgi:hypothetical protein
MAEGVCENTKLSLDQQSDKGDEMRTAGLLVALFISVPIWFYLIYRILTVIDADELTWFLFWIYVPATLFVRIVAEVATKNKASAR